MTLADPIVAFSVYAYRRLCQISPKVANLAVLGVSWIPGTEHGRLHPHTSALWKPPCTGGGKTARNGISNWTEKGVKSNQGRNLC